MSRDTHAPTGRDTLPTIRLRLDRFELMTRVVGADTRAKRARLIGVDLKTITRAIQGVVGTAFIAKTITALRQHRDVLAECGLDPTIDDLFEVVESADREDVAA